MSVLGRKKRYTVQWSLFTGLEPDDRTFRLKARNPKDAIEKTYKKVFTRQDRKNYLELTFAPDGAGIVRIVNTSREGWLVGDLIIVEE